jgi:OFA family oxalate/formate antiporter-like MFS transporter
MTIARTVQSPASGTPPSFRWMQLVIGIICMVMIANLQYGWTLFVNPINEKYQWGRAAIQVAFTIFVLTETWLVPIEGYLIDRFGPRLMVLGSGGLVGLAWVLNSYADSLFALYLAAAIGGVGAGVIYGASIGNALKWFPDRRGLTAGLTAAGFGAGSALTVVPIANMIQSSGYEAAFFWFGILQGAVIIVIAPFMRAPRALEVPESPSVAVLQTTREYGPRDVVRTPVFWVMYFMFVLIVTGGLMAVAQLAPIARDYGIDKVPVSLLGLTLPALTFALTIDRIMNGITRPIFGSISDRFGRENTMFVAFMIEGIGIWLLAALGKDPILFVLLTGLVFFAWGEIYCLFPALCADLYGKKYATTNYGLLYTAKGCAALLIPLTNIIQEISGSWMGVLVAAAGFNFASAGIALVIKRMRQKELRVPEAVVSSA